MTKIVYTTDELEILAKAKLILDSKIIQGDFSLGSPKDSIEYIRLKLRGHVAESFCILWLDNRHRALDFQELFRGTIDGASVHPREVVRAALEQNAAACILAHNHPSGDSTPSSADRLITHELRDVLVLVGVRVLDHIVIGDSSEPSSLASMGLM